MKQKSIFLLVAVLFLLSGCVNIGSVEINQEFNVTLNFPNISREEEEKIGFFENNPNCEYNGCNWVCCHETTYGETCWTTLMFCPEKNTTYIPPEKMG